MITKENFLAEFATLAASAAAENPQRLAEALSEIAWAFLEVQQRQATALEHIAGSLQKMSEPPMVMEADGTVRHK